MTGFVRDIISSYSAALSALARSSCFFVYENKDYLGNLHEITLKDVPLPLCDHFSITEECYEPDIMSKTIINVGYGDVATFGWDTRNKMTDTIVEYAPPKEMTLEEIEEKLGHKVKIVSREDE